MLNLDPWWDEAANKAAQVSLSAKGTFILGKPRAVDATRLPHAGRRPGSPQAHPTPITRVPRHA